jgi:muramidase (phage lysozyme)
MAFDPVQKCPLCEVMDIVESWRLDNAFIPVVVLDKSRTGDGFTYRNATTNLTLSPLVTTNIPLRKEIVRLNGDTGHITLKFNVKQGNLDANDRDGGTITVRAAGVRVEPMTFTGKGYNSNFELKVFCDGLTKGAKIWFIANDDDMIFDGGVHDVFCGGVGFELVRIADGFYYASDGTLLGRINRGSNLTDVYLVQDSIPKNVVTDLIGKVNRGEAGGGKLLNASSAVGMKNEELNTRAFMSTLKQAENGGNSPLPYNAWNGLHRGMPILFTEKSYEESPHDYNDHPGKRAGGSAAGAYQIMKDSWIDTWVGAKKFGVNDFSPTSQDKFIYLTIKKKLKAADVVAEGDIDSAITMTATEWRALPGPDTQSNLTKARIKELFKNNISRELSGTSDIATSKGELTKYI